MSSSSSPGSTEPLDSLLRNSLQLSVEYSDGSVDQVSGPVRLDAGANIILRTADNDEISLEVDPAGGNEDPYFRAKYDALVGLYKDQVVSGAGIDADRPAWTFTDQSIYLALLGNVPPEPESGTVFLVGDACNIPGQFQGGTGADWYPEIEAFRLSMYNMCVPCLDCLTFYRIEQFLARIRDFYDYIFDLSYTNDTAVIPPHPDGGVREEVAGIHQQLMASLRYWDNLVNRSIVKVSAQAYGPVLVTAGFYRNIANRTIGLTDNRVYLTQTFSFFQVEGGVITAWDGIESDLTDVEILSREGRCSAVLGPAGVTYPALNQVKVETVSAQALEPSQEVYSDVALILDELTLSRDPDFSYLVQIELEATPTHLGAVGLANTVLRTTSVAFRPQLPADSSEGGI